MNQAASRWLLPAIGLAVLAIASAAYGYAPRVYFIALTAIMRIPYHSPFIDAQQVPAAIACTRHGLDVYLTNPCDPLNRVWAYSPLFLWVRFMPLWNVWMGIALDAAVFLSLALLPPPRKQRDVIFLVLALFSGMPVFALERGNMDLVMFILIAIGGALWARSFGLRMIAYALFALAGFLKFYPLVLLALLARERVWAFVALCLAALASGICFVWVFRPFLHEIAANIPNFSDFTDSFGARQLPGGLRTALPFLLKSIGIHNQAVLAFPMRRIFPNTVSALLYAAALINIIRIVRHPQTAPALSSLSPTQRSFLFIGAILIAACFFAGQNGNYRGIHFLFVLPGLLALAEKPGGQVFDITAAIIFFVMWGLTLQIFIAILSGGHVSPMGGSDAIYIYWIIRELAWWWIASVLSSLLMCFLIHSPAGRLATRLLFRRTLTAQYGNAQ